MLVGFLSIGLLCLHLTMALGIPNVLQFEASSNALNIATSSQALPIIVDSGDSEALHIAATTFAEDVYRVVGQRPELVKDVLSSSSSGVAIIAATVGSSLMRRVWTASEGEAQKPMQEASVVTGLKDKWESFDIRVVSNPLPGVAEGLVVTGSDRRGVIYGLYTLSEMMGVSPWYWWADVPVDNHSTIAFPRDQHVSHGEPTVKYRGFFLNDEQPVLWNWAKFHFNMGDKPPFQTGMYEKVFELLLRLKGNYMWPAMWASMFAVDGLDVTNGLPDAPTPGPNQALAERMGVVMGTSHHEPMSRNQKEYTTWGTGEWNYTSNKQFLDDFWRYGAERAKGLETLFTVGMRGDGDLPLEGANVKLLENITAEQQSILRDVYKKDDLSDMAQMWAMYKEVMGYFANGLNVPDDVTPLLADDNWGNLMAVLPEDRKHGAGAGVYYHADYVGDPRDYKWINTVPLAKMWEQLNVAHQFKTDRIWILNVGDLKLLETPLEWFMAIAYDSDRWPIDSLLEFLTLMAHRDFKLGEKEAAEVADITAKYSMLASIRKAELIDSETMSLVNFNEAERLVGEWTALEKRAEVVVDSIPHSARIAFEEILHVQIRLYANLYRLYVAAGKSNLYATQSRTAANLNADLTRSLFDRDFELTEAFHKLVDGKWRYMLAQSHIGYQYWQAPLRNSLPPISYITTHEGSYDHGIIIHTRYTVENSLGAWPGDNRHNCPNGYACPDPTLLPMDPYGQSRWIEVGAGGNQSTDFTAKPDVDWLIVSPTHGQIEADGSTDTRVTISVDWSKLASPKSDMTEVVSGHVSFKSSDGAKILATFPVHNVPRPPSSFTGFVEGDGYVAIEAAHHSKGSNPEKYEWKEIPFYGRTLSGVAIFPVDAQRWAAGKGPVLKYDFWSVGGFDKDVVDVTLQIGPTLNFILGKPLQIAVQLDDGAPVTVQPIPDAPLGSLPADWLKVVADEVRSVNISVPIKASKPGAHTLSVWGMSTGIVLERVIVDFGGVNARGYSYLGPPESALL